MKLILLNGPPRSGKDTAAFILCNHYRSEWSVRWEKFSMPHKRAFAAMVGTAISPEGDVDGFEEFKSEIIPWLGVSYRQWQIDFSEKFMKPLYGETIFSRMFLDRTTLRKDAEGYLCIVSDCGFQIEVDTVIDKWPKNDVMLLTMSRPETSYIDDSRQYVDGSRLPEANWRTIYNEGSISELRAQLIEKTKHFVKSEADE